MKPVVLDIECYRNYLLVMFKDIASGKSRYFEMFNDSKLDTASIKKMITSRTIVTFNGNNYDLPILALALSGADNRKLKRASDAIIQKGLKYWEIERHFNIKIPKIDHIDLIEVAPGTASLKCYGGRLHSRKLQDLPIEPDATISESDRAELLPYCENDLDTTIDLWHDLREEIELRRQMTEQYGIDLMSKSDAQIAEAILKHEIQSLTGNKVERPKIKPGTKFKYQVPDFLSYTTSTMHDVLETVRSTDFVVSDKGNVTMPDELAGLKIKIGSSVYRMGIGGLHSSEKKVSHVGDNETLLVDRDVASYYPNIILNLGLFPKHMGRAFLKVYRGIVERRLEAKRTGDKTTANSLKITINGSFGKFGSKYSTLYSPDLLIQTTITGQLSLLMLIDMLESDGIPVVSANTDGVVIKCPRSRYEEMNAIIHAWELLTGFDTEETQYAGLYSRDVNCYIAVKPNGEVKQKGAFAFTGSKGKEVEKNPTNYVCIDAVIALITQGTPLDVTIKSCDDITRFITIRQVKGGAVKGDWLLGKVVRWYYAAGEQGTINYKSNGNKVPRSEGAKPLMNLPDEFPSDIDYQWYLSESESILKDIAYA